VVGAIGACTNQQVVTVTVISGLTVLINGDSIICSGHQDILTASGAITYTWSTGAHTASIIITPTITTSYSVSASLGSCVGSAVDTVMVKPAPIAAYTINPNPATIIDPLVYFTNQSVNYTSWAWNFGDGSPLDTSDVNPSHYYNIQVGNTYTTSLTLTNTDGCISTDTVLLIIEPAFTFYIPNTFTPNGDGLNDLFKGEGIGIAGFQIWVFNRWGTCIYNSKDINKGWDGTLPGSATIVQEGIYAWTVSIEDMLDVNHQYHGTVSLIK
jgi:gliding motility-associated-like protein